MIQELFPILTVADMDRSLGFYRDLLGGEVTYQFPESGEPGYVGMQIGTSHIGIGLRTEPATGTGPSQFALWCYVKDCDDAIASLRAQGVTVTVDPADQPWGERMAEVTDPDGNRVIIASR